MTSLVEIQIGGQFTLELISPGSPQVIELVTSGFAGSPGPAGPAGISGPVGPVGPAGPAGTATATNILNATGIVTLNCTNHMFKVTQTGPITFSFSNVPAATVITIIVVRTGVFAETWPSNVIWQDQIVPAASAINGLMDIYTLMTVDAGVPWIAAPFALGVS